MKIYPSIYKIGKAEIYILPGKPQCPSSASPFNGNEIYGVIYKHIRLVIKISLKFYDLKSMLLRNQDLYRAIFG